MELVKELVKKAIPSLSSDKMDALMARLVELGVQCEDDLILVEAPDIQDTLPLIQCRRLVKAFQGGTFFLFVTLICTVLRGGQHRQNQISLLCIYDYVMLTVG